MPVVTGRLLYVHIVIYMYWLLYFVYMITCTPFLLIHINVHYVDDTCMLCVCCMCCYVYGMSTVKCLLLSVCHVCCVCMSCVCLSLCVGHVPCLCFYLFNICTMLCCIINKTSRGLRVYIFVYITYWWTLQIETIHVQQ